MAKVYGYMEMIFAVLVLMIALGVGLVGYALFSQGKISLSTLGGMALLAGFFLLASFGSWQVSRRHFREWQQIEEQRRLNGRPSPRELVE